MKRKTLRPILNSGTVIQYGLTRATVLSDDRQLNDREGSIHVITESGSSEAWAWKCDGATCKIVALVESKIKRPILHSGDIIEFRGHWVIVEKDDRTRPDTERSIVVMDASYGATEVWAWETALGNTCSIVSRKARLNPHVIYIFGRPRFISNDAGTSDIGIMDGRTAIEELQFRIKDTKETILGIQQELTFLERMLSELTVS